MSDELQPSKSADRSAALKQIADALGLPVSCFYGLGHGTLSAEYHARLDDKLVLTLVRAYLQAASPEARGRFVEAVRTIADELSR